MIPPPEVFPWLSSVTGLASVPMPLIVISTTWPGAIGGVPSVPIHSTSPGCSVM